MKYAARRCRTFKLLIAFRFLLRRMQTRDWPGASRDMRAVAAQVHRVAQAGVLHGFRDRIALSLLLLPGIQRRQHQVCRAGTAEGFAERSRITDVGRKRFPAFAHKELQSHRVAPQDAHFSPFDNGIGDDGAGIPAALPKITYTASFTTSTLSLGLFIFISPLRRALFAASVFSFIRVDNWHIYAQKIHWVARRISPNYIGEGYSIKTILEAVLRFF